MARKIEEFSLTTFEVWCFKAREYFKDMKDENGLIKAENTLKMIDIFRQYGGELFFLEGE